MEGGRFFYSISGNDVHGPVAGTELRQLWLDNRIGPGSFLCRAGEMNWVPCNPGDYPPRAPRVRTMVIVPSKMMATLLAAEHNSPLAKEVASSSVALLEPPSDDFSQSKRVTIRLTSPAELLAKAPEVSRTRSLRGALLPTPPFSQSTMVKRVPAAGAQAKAETITKSPAPPPSMAEALLKAPAIQTPPAFPDKDAKLSAIELPNHKQIPVDAPVRVEDLLSAKPAIADALAKIPSAKPKPTAPPTIAPLSAPESKRAPFYAGALTLVAGFFAKVTSRSPRAASSSPTTELASLPAPMPRAIPSLVEAPALLAPAHVPPPLPMETKPFDLSEEDTIEDEEKPEDLGSFAIVLNFLAALAAIGAGGLVAFFAHPAEGSDFYVFACRCGAFVATLLLIVVIPFVVSLLTQGDFRVITRSGGMVVLAVLISILYLVQPGSQPAIQARAITQQQKQEAQKQIADKGYYTGNSDQAEQNIEKLKGQLTDNSERSRIGRAILTVTAELLAKVKASDAIEKTCNFTLEGVAGADDLAARGRSIKELHDAQANVITFLDNYDLYCHQALDSDNIAAATQDEVTASARKGAHVDLLVALWQEKMKLSDDYIARFGFLRKNWGQWQLKDGEVVFFDDKQTASHEALVQAVQDDIMKIHDTQRQIFQ